MLERNVNKYLIIITGINEKPSGFLNRIVKIQKLIYFNEIGRHTKPCLAIS